jgi:cilia- and flagella-associated protein 298
MVLIHLKSTNTNTNNNGNDDTSFMYETTTSTKVDELIKSLVEIHNSKTGESINANDACLWTCGKEFVRGKVVSDRLGSCNEKTKIICKLTIKGERAPMREPIVSEAERNAMTEFYFKRQEEMKKLALADEDDYMNSQWADPKGMKKSLQGLNDVKAPGFR